MKSLVIYYSKTGNTKLMGETIAEEIKADLLELQPEKDLPTKGSTVATFYGQIGHINNVKIFT